MSKYQYKSILVRYGNDKLQTYCNVDNLTEVDSDGFFEFDSTFDLSHLSSFSEVTTTHIKSCGKIVEYSEMI